MTWDVEESSHGFRQVCVVSGSNCKILKCLSTAFVAAKKLGWKVSVKGIRFSLFETDCFRAVLF